MRKPIVVPLDERLQLDLKFEPGEVVRPVEIEVANGKISWSLRGLKTERPRASVLDKFRRLHQQSDDEIASFVRNYGAAGFCSHGLPMTHAHIPSGMQFGLDECAAWSKRGLESWYVEDLANYRLFSIGAEAVLEAAGLVNIEEVPPEATIGNFRSNVGRGLSRLAQTAEMQSRGARATVDKRARLTAARYQIAEEINWWAAITQTHLRLQSGRDGKAWTQSITHDPWSVLGAVAVALFTTVPQANGWLPCSACGATFRIERTPAAGRNRYCPGCRNGPMQWAHLKRLQREKITDARRLHAKGIPVSEIAKQLEVRSVDSVRRWVKKA
jgi:hypothetical protein